jgi:hypothetical protein
MDSYKERQKQNLSNAYELSEKYWVKIRRVALGTRLQRYLDFKVC